MQNSFAPLGCLPEYRKVYKSQVRDEKRTTRKIQARCHQLAEEQGIRPDSSLDTGRAALEVIILAESQLQALSEASSSRSPLPSSPSSSPSSSPPSSPWSWSSDSGTHPPHTSSNQMRSSYEKEHSLNIRMKPSQPLANSGTIPHPAPLRTPMSPRAESSPASNQDPEPKSTSATNCDAVAAAENVAEDIDAHGKWVFPAWPNSDNARHNTSRKRFGARVKDGDGRITWSGTGVEGQDEDP